MGKHEVGTPKYIANKIKAKGLQKLRWYCQMCEKQCRDENGFKCHTMSESHHRQLLLFADNANRYMDQFSREFSQGYLNLLKRQFGTRRVPANRVYQEYIADRGHIHMNATMWLSLTGFVKWLGRTGQCVVDETEKGWFVTYIDRDPETVAAQERKAKKQKMDKDDEERMMEFIEKQVERGRTEEEEQSNEFKEPLMRPEEDKPLILEIKLKPKIRPIPGIIGGLSAKRSVETERKPIKEEPISEDEENRDEEACSAESAERKSDSSSETSSHKRRKTDDRIDYKNRDGDGKDERSRSKRSRKESERGETSKDVEEGWLREGLVVKIVTRSLGEKYYKAKGIVQDPVEGSGFIAKVKLTTPEDVEGHVIKIDQEYLETVIPAIGKRVLILSGKHRGAKACIRQVRIEDYCADVQVEKSSEIVKRLPYEQICKYVD